MVLKHLQTKVKKTVTPASNLYTWHPKDSSGAILVTHVYELKVGEKHEFSKVWNLARFVEPLDVCILTNGSPDSNGDQLCYSRLAGNIFRFFKINCNMVRS